MEPAGYNRRSAPGSSRKGSRKGQKPLEPTHPPVTTTEGPKPLRAAPAPPPTLEELDELLKSLSV